MVKKEENAEFVGQIIDIFEDFLSEKGISIENSERQEYFGDDEEVTEEDMEGLSIIFGSDYDVLQSELENMMKEWNIFEDDSHCSNM